MCAVDSTKVSVNLCLPLATANEVIQYAMREKLSFSEAVARLTQLALDGGANEKRKRKDAKGIFANCSCPEERDAAVERLAATFFDGLFALVRYGGINLDSAYTVRQLYDLTLYDMTRRRTTDSLPTWEYLSGGVRRMLGRKVLYACSGKDLPSAKFDEVYEDLGTIVLKLSGDGKVERGRHQTYKLVHVLGNTVEN